jgi:actin-related protein 6
VANGRLNVGGKLLTNYLKEVISYRHYNMMEESHLINKVKESCCFISQNFSADLERIKAKKGAEIRFVLPDYSHSKEGHVLKEGEMVGDDLQVLVLGNERFAIPELLFTPSDVGTNPIRKFLSGTYTRLGSKQGGIVEGVMQAVAAAPEEYRSLLLANIVPVGGNFNILGFSERLYLPSLQPSHPTDTGFREREIRAMAPSMDTVRFLQPKEFAPFWVLADLVPWYVRGKEVQRSLQIESYSRARS